jgi:hypothetical protein
MIANLKEQERAPGTVREPAGGTPALPALWALRMNKTHEL